MQDQTKGEGDVKKTQTINEKELQILQFWNENNIQHKSMTENRGDSFAFYDGPPFATGLPHHGHLLQSYIKDSVPRYQTMQGKAVRRVWGWDCHGLPIENLIEKNLGLKNKSEIEALGKDKFTSAAMNQVLAYEEDWKKMVPRWGRWVDMEHRYMTLTSTYTESVWWAFSELYKKGLAYEGYKVMHVCPRCETPLAASEVALNYADVTDVSVYVKFELVDTPNTFLLAWTTTPWTLPGNTAIVVGRDIVYVEVSHNAQNYIVAKELTEKVFTGLDFSVMREFPGSELIGKSYKPVFDYYTNDKAKAEIKNYENIYKVWHADFVDTSMGTGIAHEAPAFGEDDYKLAQENNIPTILHVAMNGAFKSDVTDFAGMVVKKKGDSMSADRKVCEFLAAQNKILKTENYKHSYPLCWRCDTPLLNYATSSWFVAVSQMRERLVEENKKVTWIPDNVRDGRMGQWLEGARDWAVSRNRYWGAPLPVWKSDATGEVFVPGSLADLQKRTKANNTYTFVRHGETVSNVDSLVSVDMTAVDGLTEKGKNIVLETSKKLEEAGKTFDIIISSPYQRTRETAEILKEKLNISNDILFDDRLKEWQVPAEFQGRPWSEFLDLFYKKVENSYFGKYSSESESRYDAGVRMAQFVYEVEEKFSGKNILVVSHSSPIAALEIYNSGKIYDKAGLNTPEWRHLENGEVFNLDFKPLPHNAAGEVDFHIPYIEDLKVYDAEGNVMRKEGGVFDCWYESGSMPYAQFHYPFENQELFKNNFPADFIAEAQDQTRGWFYTMLVLGVALFDRSPFKAVICSGLINAADGKKLSKSLKNFTDPMEVIDQYGSDALRYYILSSPVVKGESMRFSDLGVGDVYRKNIVRLQNVLSMYSGYKQDLQGKEYAASSSSKNVLDVYMIARLKELQKGVARGFDEYRIDEAFRPVEKFIDDLSVWYVRRSRERFKSDDETTKKEAVETLRYVLFEFSKVLAPIMPFVSEMVYQETRAPYDVESVHLSLWSSLGEITVDEAETLRDTEKARSIITDILAERIQVKQKVRQPLAKAFVISDLEISNKDLISEIMEETNVKEFVFQAAADFAEGKRVILDTVITEELRIEGALRELARSVQDRRKEMKLVPSDLATLELTLNTDSQTVRDLLEGNSEYVEAFKKQCNIKTVKVNVGDVAEAQDFLDTKLSFVISL